MNFNKCESALEDVEILTTKDCVSNMMFEETASFEGNFDLANFKILEFENKPETEPLVQENALEHKIRRNQHLTKALLRAARKYFKEKFSNIHEKRQYHWVKQSQRSKIKEFFIENWGVS